MFYLVKRFTKFFVLLLVLAVGYLLYWMSHPIKQSHSTASIEFTIEPGSSLNNTTRKIVEAGVPINSNLFIFLVRCARLSNRLQAGTYVVKLGMTPIDLMHKLANGDSVRYAISIIEGWTFAQMRKAIDTNPNIRHDTIALTNLQLLHKITQNANTSYIASEGLFFPDTYFFDNGSSDLKLYIEAYETMQKRLQNVWQTRALGLPYKSPYEALIMASIIEKESGQNGDRALISGVFLNRLKINMPLQTDPSVIYAMGDKYQGKIGKSGLATNSPYNTYLHTGLPPTPICLPSAAALVAATHPVLTKALYFVGRGNGSSHFSNTLQEHNAAVDRYIRGNK